MLRVSGGIRRFVLPGKIFWANEADIAPEWLYDNGVSCCPKKNSHLRHGRKILRPYKQ